MKRIQLCLGWMVWLTLGLAGSGRGAEPFEGEIRAFEASDKTNAPPTNAVLFVGSSSIRLWSTLARDFPELATINRGFGGSQIADSVRYADRIVIPYQPRLIVFYAGGNDINAGKKPEEVARDFEERFVRSLERDMKKAGAAMDHMAIVLSQIKRDCTE